MKETRRYKILFVGDASNYFRCLAEGLRRLGHEVTVASSGSGWLNTERDIDLSRPFNNKLGGLLLWLKARWLLRKRLAGHDIAVVNGVCFMLLRPGRLARAFDSLKRRNGHIFMSALGTDPYYVEACLSDDYLRYNEFMVNGEPSPLFKAKPMWARQWTTPELKSLVSKIYSESEGVLPCLYEYHESCRRVLPPEKVEYIGIPIDTASIAFEPIPKKVEKVKFFLGRHRDRQMEKGTDILERVVARVVRAYPDRAELTIVENRPYDEYLQLLREAHVVIDQLYSYTPATNALLAMAMGKVVVSGAEPEFYDFISEKELKPIINPIPGDEQDLYNKLEQLVLHPEQLSGLGSQSREFVVKHNDVIAVANRFLRFCTKNICK